MDTTLCGEIQTMSTLLRFFLFTGTLLFWPQLGCATARIAGSGGEVSLGAVSVQLRSHGSSLPHFWHHGQIFVLGRRGQPYSILIRNLTNQRIEVVTAVDGRDVINGQPTRPDIHRGYVLNPYAYVDITGFRTSQHSVAAFRFSSISSSYAARMGGPLYDIGSIRVSVFREHQPIAYIPHPHPVPFRRGAHDGRAEEQRQPATRDADREPAPSRAKSAAGMPYHRWRRPFRPPHQPGLGTAYGEHQHAPSVFTTFRRASMAPTWQLALRYNNCAGFQNTGIFTRYCRPYHYRPRPIIIPPPHTPPYFPPSRYSPAPPSYGD